MVTPLPPNRASRHHTIPAGAAATRQQLLVFVAIVALATLLSSCAQSGYFGMSKDLYLADGSTILLNQPVSVPRNAVAAPIRGGSIASRFRYEGHCRLELRTLSSEARIIEPDEFRLLRTNWRTDYYGALPARSVRASLFDLHGSSRYSYTTYMYLQSQAQPDVYRLRCQHLQLLDDHPRFLTVDQIQTIVGEIMTITRMMESR